MCDTVNTVRPGKYMNFKCRFILSQTCQTMARYLSAKFAIKKHIKFQGLTVL